MMRQTVINELDWLEPDWIPTKVTMHCNHKQEMSPEEFDELQAKSYGYKSIKEMHQRNYTRDKLNYLRFGDRVNGLIKDKR